ncbi:SsrA-binding protein SmpB [Candidatus Peribacteria bacterium]|nr:SsrA-binding protein SmpB [Candidatus Peribacteria bacterium]
MPPLLQHRAATYHYEILETYEAGMVLSSWEVKSLKAKHAHMKSAYARIDDGEVWLYGLHISPWQYTTTEDMPPTRPRKLLLHQREIERLHAAVQQKRLTLVPLSIFLVRGRIKLSLGLGKGRKRHEKKQVLKERSITKDLRQQGIR